jgi:hypothetical protein
MKRDDCDGYQAPYPTPFEMLHQTEKPSHGKDRDEITYKAPPRHWRRFGCYATGYIPELQKHGTFTM